MFSGNFAFKIVKSMLECAVGRTCLYFIEKTCQFAQRFDEDITVSKAFYHLKCSCNFSTSVRVSSGLIRFAPGPWRCVSNSGMPAHLLFMLNGRFQAAAREATRFSPAPFEWCRSRNGVSKLKRQVHRWFMIWLERLEKHCYDSSWELVNNHKTAAQNACNVLPQPLKFQTV